MYSQAQLNTVLSETKDGLTRIFGDSLCDVLLYGSCARGEQDEESDIDVMALVNLPKTALSQYRRMVSDLSSSIDLRRDVLLSIKLQDMDSFQRYGKTLPYFQNVRREGVRVVISAGASQTEAPDRGAISAWIPLARRVHAWYTVIET